MKITVLEGWQLGDDQGNVYQPGESFDAPDGELAKQWIEAGMASKAKAAEKASDKARTAPNK